MSHFYLEREMPLIFFKFSEEIAFNPRKLMTYVSSVFVIFLEYHYFNFTFFNGFLSVI